MIRQPYQSSDLILHDGIDYHLVCQELSKKRITSIYLEIGVESGFHLSYMHCKHAIAVDPVFRISTNIMMNKESVELHQISSDRFFASLPPTMHGPKKVDFAFLDGYHTFEFLLRDFYNTEKNVDPNALIVLHDCLPMTAEMADRNEARAYERSKTTNYPQAWTGDVWKVIPILQKFRPDLRIYGVTCPPTGIVCITNVSPSNRILEERYLDIVDEYARMPNDAETIAECYKNLTIVGSETILKDQDHSLFFRV